MKAVIFDVDGVLVRSMEKHYEAYREVLGARGVRIEPHEVYENEGRRAREVLASLAQRHGLQLDAAALDELNGRKQRLFMSFGPQPLYPGVLDMLDTLRARGLRKAMVTGTTTANVHNHLRDVLERFEAIVTADDVTHTKPHPEPYQTALRKLGVEPGEAVVVENAVLGIRSAKAAGLRVVAVASTLEPEMLREADVVVASIDRVPRALEGLD